MRPCDATGSVDYHAYTELARCFDIRRRPADNCRVSAPGVTVSRQTTAEQPIRVIGFIGLGVMGEPMCGHLARRCGLPVLAHDLRPEPLERLAGQGVRGASVQQIATACDLILLSLPDGKAVAAIVGELEPHLRAGQCIVDTSTSSVALTREIGARLSGKGILYADAPVARTRDAAARGELSIMVGATDETFARIRPILDTMGTDVTHCGPIGCGQVVKILNNMLVFQHTAALAEAIAIGRRNGVEPDVLLPTMALGSGDSFVLRNHGMKAMLPGVFPDRAFSTRYAMKDLSYALEMADASGLDMKAAKLTMERLKETEAAGYGDQYHPVVLKVIDRP
jgi:3-hydroxyisobutyrate dehydrogenase-like beta-hydroxyacid dehydrogenase